MKLKIKKHHSLPPRGPVSGDFSFHVVCKLELSAEEQTLVDRYLGGDCSVASFETTKSGEPRMVRLIALQRGYTASSKSTETLSELIALVTKGCESLSDSLAKMNRWNAEYVICIPSEDVGDDETIESEGELKI
jgi:hypothetical protein